MKNEVGFVDRLIASLRTGAPEYIGAGSIQQESFREGWKAAMSHIWTQMECSALESTDHLTDRECHEIDVAADEDEFA